MRTWLNLVWPLTYIVFLSRIVTVAVETMWAAKRHADRRSYGHPIVLPCMTLRYMAGRGMWYLTVGDGSLGSYVRKIQSYLKVIKNY